MIEIIWCGAVKHEWTTYIKVGSHEMLKSV